jgi:RNA polymerase primary sigma factor
MAKNEAHEVDTADEGDAPLLDLNDASVKKMMARAEKRGTITIDEINSAIPADQNEMIEDIMSRLSERGVTVVENEESSDDDEQEKEAEPEEEVDPLDDGGPRPAAAVKKEPTDRTDDPVRMYLRERRIEHDVPEKAALHVARDHLLERREEHVEKQGIALHGPHDNLDDG